MELALDSDALIKLNRAGVLAVVGRAFACFIPEEVYREAVVVGRMHGHADADAIDEILASGFQILTSEERISMPSMGVGEMAVLNILPQLTDAVIVSDDRRFLTMLGASGIRHLTPTNVLVALARQRILSESDAHEALERLRPAIQLNAYRDARVQLEYREEGQP